MRNTSKRKQIIIYIALIVWTIINIFPVYWMFTFSLKSNPEIFGENIIGLPKEWLWSNYETALTTGNMWLYFMNSAIVATATILITLAVSLMATFALTRLIWKRRKTMNKFFMLGLTIPIHASIVPVYVTLSRMNMLNTYWALIIPYAAFSLAMAILVCVGFMNEIPRELDESACIDGCGDHCAADEAGCCNGRDLHLPAVLERADVRQCVYQQFGAEDAACRCPGAFRTVYDGVGTHRRGAGPGDLPDPDRLYLPEQEDSGKLYRRCSQRLIKGEEQYGNIIPAKY